MNKRFRLEDDHVVLELNPKIYSKETIFAAGYIFLDKAYIILDEVKDAFLVYLYPQDNKIEMKKLALDFFNELLNYAHYFTRAQSNVEAVKLIMQRALFSAAPSLVQEAEDKEIQDLIKELEEEEKAKENESIAEKRKK